MPASTETLPGWKNAIGWTCAIVMAIVWLVAGIWKLSDIAGWQIKLSQMLVPTSFTLIGTMAVSAGEVLAGVLLLRPAWRRLGGLMSTLLLLVFMAYMAINYTALKGADCTCFPWLERAVGPAFFWSDAAMVAVSLLAAWFAPRVAEIRRAGTALVGVALLSSAALGYHWFGPQPGSDVPETITVAEQQYNLRQGRVFVYFFNPSCMHCLDAGILLSEHKWKGDFVALATEEQNFAEGFLKDAGLADIAKLSPDLEILRETFPFDLPPYAAVIENGKVLERIGIFEEPALGETLRGHGLIE